jgi:hypothetical protein
MMRHLLIWLFVIASFPALAKEGGNGSHGGGAFLCQDPARNELLDLWEGTARGLFPDFPKGLTYKRMKPRSPEDRMLYVRRQIQLRLGLFRQVQPELGLRAEEAYAILAANRIDRLPSDPPLPPIRDAFTEYLKPGCVLTPAAIYSDELSKLLLDVEVAAQLPAMDLAALWVHEAIYKVLRDAKLATDSRTSRQIVAILFAADLDQLERSLTIRDRIGQTAPEARPPLLTLASRSTIEIQPDSGGGRWFGVSVVGWPTNAPACDQVRWEIFLDDERIFKGNQGVETRINIDQTGGLGVRRTLEVGCAVRFDWAYFQEKKQWPERGLYTFDECLPGYKACGFDVVIRDDRGHLYEGPEVFNRVRSRYRNLQVVY